MASGLVWVSSGLTQSLDLDRQTTKDLDTNSFAISGSSLSLGAVGVAKETDPAVNGGLTPDYVIDSSTLWATAAMSWSWKQTGWSLMKSHGTMGPHRTPMGRP